MSNEVLTEVLLLSGIAKNQHVYASNDYIGRTRGEIESRGLIDEDDKSFKIGGMEVVLARVNTGVHVVGIENGTCTLFLGLNRFGSGKNTYSVGGLAGRGNRVKAVELYAELIRRFDYIISSSEQSLGGQAVWMKLARVPGVAIMGWDDRRKKAVNIGLDPDDDSETHTPEKTLQDAQLVLRKDKSYAEYVRILQDIANLYIVAFRDSKKVVLKEDTPLNEIRFMPSIRKGEKIGRAKLYVGRTKDDVEYTMDYDGYRLTKVYKVKGSEVWMTNTVSKERRFFVFDGNVCTLYLSVLQFGVTSAKSYEIYLVSAENSKLKAHELYAFLIRDLGFTLLTDNQSAGGYSIWKKLSKYNDITMFGWDRHKARPINISIESDNFLDTHVDDSFMRRMTKSSNHRDYISDYKKIKRMMFVAHKTIPSGDIKNPLKENFGINAVFADAFDSALMGME